MSDEATGTFNGALEIERIKIWNSALRKPKRDEKFNDLVNSVKEQGVLLPVLVRPNGDGTYTLVDGAHRYAASIEAGRKTIPARIQEMTEEQAFITQITANEHNITTRPSDYSKGFRRLLAINPNWTVTTLAQRIGKSPSYINDRLAIDDLSEKCKAALDAGDLKLGHAVAMSELAPEIQDEMLSTAQENLLPAFQSLVKIKLKELRDKTPKERKEPTFEPRPVCRKVESILGEIDTLENIKRFIKGLTVPEDIATATLRWVMGLDPDSIDAQKAKWDAFQKLAAEKKKKAAQENVAADANK